MPIEELSIVAHSMGGLLARSAIHYGSQERSLWPDRLRSVVFLGTPHHGAALVDEDWLGHDRFRRKPDSRTHVPLPDGIACYAVAATTATKRGALADRLVGDGLVPLHSALGRHDDAQCSLAFAKASQWIAYRMNHMELLRSPRVTRRMVRWLTPRG